MGATLLIAVTLPAAAAVQPTATRDKAPTSGSARHPDMAGALTAAAQGGAGNSAQAETTAADPAKAGQPAGGSLTTGSNAIPALALKAYRKAAATLAVEDPSCHLGWPLLAGIGKVESDHGRSWGSASRVTSTGEVVPTILGPVLDGTHDTALVRDTDRGSWDGNTTYDRAVGPMQFLPETWKSLGRDGNGDGIRDPNNMWDATLATASYLCTGGRNLENRSDVRAAVLSYNPSDAYVTSVLAWASAYQQAASKVPGLDQVPTPLVLGANGTEGDDPYGDSSSDASSEDPSYQDPSFDDPGDGSNADAPPVIPTETPTPTPTPRVTPTVTPTPGRTPAPSRSVTPTPSKSPTPSKTPSPTPSAGPTPTPSATPTPSTTPSTTPTPPPSGPTCDDPGVTAPQADVTAVPVDTNGDGVDDLLRVTASVTSSRPGDVTLGVRLTDSSGYRITSLLETVTLHSGQQQVTADLPGADIGDAGASGPASIRLTARPGGADVGCAKVVIAAAGVSVDASAFDGWVTSLDRLRERLGSDIAAGTVSGEAAISLPALLSPPGGSPDLAAFRAKLATVTFVKVEERVRLDSLAQRLQSQGGAQPAAGGSFGPLVVDDSADGVG
jgi:hypothetical protein